jgi:hypothetical protein
MAADALRPRDSRATIALFTAEWVPPYHRPPLSKE